MIFTKFDISAGRKAGTKKQSLVSETLYIFGSNLVAIATILKAKDPA